MTPKEILALPMEPNDANASTIGEYFTKLLVEVWDAGEGFSGKRPFGNSGWEYDLYLALAKNEAMEGTFTPDGYLDDYDDEVAHRLITEAIQGMIS